ncbi:MAG TPA: phosphoglycerate mutase [Xylella taiwanensis]
MSSATLLLPERTCLLGTLAGDAVARAFARADRLVGGSGGRAQLERHFELTPAHWPVAALTRQIDVGDAAGSAWVRADPAYVVPDMGAARLVACGETLALDAKDRAALLPALQTLFSEAGLLLDAPTPARWYLQLTPEARLPTFASPDDVLGDDLFDHLPDGDTGRRWRALLTEVQVLLHQHPWNGERVACGKRMINSLWFWGEGVLPHMVTTPHRQVRSRDVLLRALTKASGADVDSLHMVDALVDLRHLRSLVQFSDEVVAPLLAAMGRGELGRLVLDFRDGEILTMTRAHRWRFWCGVRTKLAE